RCRRLGEHGAQRGSGKGLQAGGHDGHAEQKKAYASEDRDRRGHVYSWARLTGPARQPGYPTAGRIAFANEGSTPRLELRFRISHHIAVCSVAKFGIIGSTSNINGF